MSEMETTFDRAETPEEEAALLAARDLASKRMNAAAEQAFIDQANRAQEALVVDTQAEQAVIAQAMASLPPVEAPAGVALAPVLQESAVAPSAGPLATPGAAPALGELVAYVLDDGSDTSALVIFANDHTPTLLVQVAPEFTAPVTRRQFPAVPFGDTPGCWHHVSEA